MIRHRIRRHYRRRIDWSELAGGLFLGTLAAAMLAGMLAYSITFDCKRKVHLGPATQHLCHLMGL